MGLDFTGILYPQVSLEILNTRLTLHNSLVTFFLQHFRKFVNLQLALATCKTLPA